MTITISPETQLLLEDRMRADGYATIDEAVQAAMRALQAQDETDRSPETLAAIQRGMEDADAGRTRPWEEVKAELNEKYGL